MATYPHFIDGETYRVSSTPVIMFRMVSEDDHINAMTGIASFDAAKISKNGGAFNSLTNSPSELDSTNSPGVYKITLTSTETNTAGPLVLSFIESGADPTIVTCRIYNYAIPSDPMTLDAASIKSDTFDTGAITATSIASSAISSAKFAAGAIDNAALANDALSAAKIAAGAITSAKFASGAITSGVLANACIDFNHFATGAITADVLDGACLTSAAFATDAIAAAAIKADAVTKVADGAWNKAMPVSPTVGTMAAYLKDTEIYAAENYAVLQDNLDTTVSSRASASALTTVDGKLPAALVGGKIDANVGTFTAAALTSAAFATDAIAAAAVKADAVTKIQTGLATSAALTTVDGKLPAALVGGKMDANVGTFTTGAITSGAFTAGAIDSAAIATDAIDAASIKADAVTKIQAGLATASALTTVDGKLPSALVGGKMDANVGTFTAAALTSAAFATDAIAAAAVKADAVTKIQAGLATSSALTTVDGKLPATLVSGRIDASVGAMATDAVSAAAVSAAAVTKMQSGLATSSALTTVDGKLPAALVGGKMDANIGSISTGAIVAASFGAGAITSTVAPNLDAAVSSRAIPGDHMGLDTNGKTDVQDALTSQGVTLARAGYLDRLDVSSSTINNKLPAALVGGKIDANLGSISAGTITTASFAAGSITSAVAPNLDASVSSRAVPGDDMGLSAGGMTAVGTALDTQGLTLGRAVLLDHLDDDITTRSAPGDAMTLEVGAISDIETAMLDAAGGVDSSITVREALKIILAVCAGKTVLVSGNPATVTIRDIDDTKDRVVATISGGSRTNVVLDKS